MINSLTNPKISEKVQLVSIKLILERLSTVGDAELRQRLHEAIQINLCQSISYIGRRTFLLIMEQSLINSSFSIKYIKLKFMDMYLSLQEEKVSSVLIVYVRLIP